MSKLKGNCCPKCGEKHEVCSDTGICENSDISLQVCIMFGTREPRRVVKKKQM